MEPLYCTGKSKLTLVPHAQYDQNLIFNPQILDIVLISDFQ